MFEVRGMLFCFVLPLLILSCQLYQILKGRCGLGAQCAACLFRCQASVALSPAANAQSFNDLFVCRVISSLS